jgi:hypothetical protein
MTNETDDEKFGMLMETIDRFEAMLKQRMDEIKELHDFFRIAAAELQLHHERLKKLEKGVFGNE